MQQSGPVRRGGGRGFTLVELLVVVAIIALLVSILMPSLARAKELARMAVCKANLHGLGRAWQMYWNQNNYRTPALFNPRNTATDTMSMFNFLTWCNAGSGGPGWVGAGVLYPAKFVASGDIYVCPTINSNVTGKWYSPTAGSFTGKGNNRWPPIDAEHTRTCYGIRRMKSYDNPVQGAAGNEDPSLMLRLTTVGGIKNAAKFSYMGDCFSSPALALLSHVPEVEVQFLDGHVSYYRDEKGDVLYNNGIDQYVFGVDPTNWLHDDIWMIIDGYHQPPAGQGK